MEFTAGDLDRSDTTLVAALSAIAGSTFVRKTMFRTQSTGVAPPGRKRGRRVARWRDANPAGRHAQERRSLRELRGCDPAPCGRSDEDHRPIRSSH
jgi:hypothetical protein